MVIEELELKKSVLNGVRKTVNKFREQPYIFFTEMDIHSYFYRCLYSKRSEVKTQDGVVTTCLHQEYPTNFRTSESMEDYGLGKVGQRGHHDLAVLNPKFIADSDIRNVVNKDIRDLEARSRNKEMFRSELIAAIEMKYVIHNSSSFIDEINKDLKKLSIALKYQDFEAYNLVFCNLKYYFLDELKKVIEKADPAVKSLLAISYYANSKKVTPKPITNGWNVQESSI
jgi:hypothetical protein